MTTDEKRNDSTSIEWTHWPGYRGASWNFLRGCSRVPPAPGATQTGCGDSTGGGCYAERDGGRWCGPGKPFDGLIRITKGGPRWTGLVTYHPHKLDEPLRKRHPHVFFVNSVSDLFHDDVREEWLDEGFAVMALATRHVFIALTKRSSRMRAYLSDPSTPARVAAIVARRALSPREGDARLPDYRGANALSDRFERGAWPLRNVVVGVSTENQAALDLRLPDLLATPAHRRVISAEPLLERVALLEVATRAVLRAANLWLIVGGESGNRARPFALEWAQDLITECADLEVPCFVKQLGEVVVAESPGWPVPTGVGPTTESRGWWRYTLTGKAGDPEEWPPSLRVRQVPELAR